MRPVARPLGHRVIVLPLEEQESTERGIVLPDTVRESLRSRRGTVIAVGEHVLELQIGEEVAYPSGAGHVLELLGEDGRVERQVVLAEEQVLAVVEESADREGAQA